MTTPNAMKRAFTVGLTGGIGSGKSTVADDFAALGAFVVDADGLSHQLTAPHGAALAAISATFKGVVTGNELNRAALRELVFTNSAARKSLEAILHPMIRTATNEALASSAAQNAPYVILMVPLLFESGTYEKRIDCAVVVDVDEATQIERVARTRGMAVDEVKRIIVTQMTRSERLALTQFVVDNSGTREALRAQIAALHSVFLVNASAITRALISPTAKLAQ